MCMRKLIVIACIAAVLVAVVVVAPIEAAPFAAVETAVTVPCQTPRVNVQLVALSANTHLRAPPA